MSRQRSGNKTPARVQVFYFEKQKTGRPSRPAPTLDKPIARDADALPDVSALPTPPPSPRRTPSRSVRRARATREGERARSTTDKIPAVEVVEDLRARAATEPETPRTTPAAVPAASAREALEYHRLRLQQLAARGAASSRSIAKLALFGHALHARGRMREAQVVFESIVAREPDEAFAYTMLGAIYLAQEDEARALALFEAALGLESDDLAALVGRGEIRLRRGQPRLALQDLERAIAADPSGRDPFSERARALCVLARTLSRALSPR